MQIDNALASELARLWAHPEGAAVELEVADAGLPGLVGAQALPAKSTTIARSRSPGRLGADRTCMLSISSAPGRFIDGTSDAGP